MKIFKTLALITLIVITAIISCKKGNKTSQEQTPVYHDLDNDGIAFWDNEPSVEVDSNNVILPNGLKMVDFLAEINSNNVGVKGHQALNTVTTKTLGPQDAKNELVANLTQAALYFTNRNNFNYPDDGTGKPAQHGLAYSWGQRNYKIRALPPGKGNQCKEQVYGLDCSGLFYQLFNMSGVQVSNGTAEDQRKPAELEAAIKAAYPKLTKIKVEDLGKITNFQTGDIIYWLESDGKAHHIGVILNNDGEMEVAQSNGDQVQGCETNYTAKRGPRWSKLKNAILSKNPSDNPGGIKGFGNNYGIVRINSDISGDWTFAIGCQGIPGAPPLTLPLTFPVNTPTTFTQNVNATDYNGNRISFNLTFTYDNKTNTLSASWITNSPDISGFERKDNFSLQLNRDQSQVNAGNDYIHGGTGCAEVVFLSDLEKQDVHTQLKHIRDMMNSNK